MEKALTICLYEWKLILRNRRTQLFIIIFPCAMAVLAASFLAANHALVLLVGLAAVAFVYRGMGKDEIAGIPPITRHIGRSLAMLPIFVLQANLYALVLGICRPSFAMSAGQIALIPGIALLTALLTNLFAD